MIEDIGRSRQEEVGVTAQRFFSVMTHSFVMVAMAVSFAGLSAFSAEAADETPIRLELRLERGTGRTFVLVVPPKAKIWRSTPDKPRAIYLTGINTTEYVEVALEIRYNDSDKGASADYFGDIDIACGQKGSMIVEPSEIPDAAGAEWPYTVTVYACKDGAKAQVVGTANARIIWAD
jgi:hypothetical protein